MENIIEEVKRLMKSAGGKVLEDSDGNTYTDINDVPEGVSVSVVNMNGKKDLYRLLWGKERVGGNDVQEIIDLAEDIKNFVIENASPATKSKLKSQFKG